MSDPRIEKYYEAVVALQEGRFDVSVPIDSSDDLAKLGKAIRELALVLEKRFQEVEQLSKITERINAGLVLEEVLDFLYESFRPVIPYDRIGLALLEGDGQVVRSRWARFDGGELLLKEGYSTRLKGSSLEEIIRTAKPRIINDLESYLREHPWSESTKRIVDEGMRSSLTCPLLALGKPVGFIFFSSRKAHTYKGAHQDLFLNIAGQLSVILEKSRLYQQVLELNRELLKAQSELEHQATHDVLTKLWNRGAILEVLDRELSRSRRESKPLAVIMCDIDRFKKLNDTEGHQVGDAVLVEVAHRLGSTVRGSEWVGRYGGEEFLVIAYPCDQPAASALMERLRARVGSTPVRVDGRPLRVTVSLGAAVGLDTRKISADALIRVADEALYRAKKAGRNRSEVRRTEEEGAL